jgi:hypothetical protein
MRLSALPFCILFFWTGHAHDSRAAETGIPPLRLPPEQVTEAAQRIDDAIVAQDRDRWERASQAQELRERKQGRQPAPRTPLELPPQVDDATFLRRVSLDLTARNPDTKVMRAFLSITDPEKRGKMVDRLQLGAASAARRFTRLADMLRVKDTALGVSLRPYAAWLQDACASARPYDEVVRELITASGEVDTNPATGWLLGDAGDCATTMTEALRIFLDEDISCARCHDHPYNNWTQKGFYQISACLSGAQVLRSGPGGVVRLWPVEPGSAAPQTPLAANERLLIADFPKLLPWVLPRDYKYINGRTGDVAKPTLWQWKGDEAGNPQSKTNVRPDKLRSELATWFTGNQRFAEVAALRAWIGLFGGRQDAYAHVLEFSEGQNYSAGSADQRSCSWEGARNLSSCPGGASLTDNFSVENSSPANRRFMLTLARELVKVRYDLREFERILCHTAAYQRESITADLGMPPRPVAPLLRRLPAETVWNNLVLVQSDGGVPGGAPLSHELAQVPDAGHPSRLLGRGARQWADDSLPLITHRMVRLMMNGDSVKLATGAESPLVRRLRQTQPADAAVEEAFMAVLSRPPSHDEKIKTMDYVIAQPATGWGDVVWSLLNTSEFLFQR